MKQRYTDTHNIVESLRKASEELDEGRMSVVEADQCRVVNETKEDLEHRNLFDYVEHLFTIEWENNQFGGMKLNLCFHQNLVDNEFTLSPADPNGMHREQATQPADLSSTLDEVLSPMEDEMKINKWDFCKVVGASVAYGGHITDFEFKYDTFVQ